MFKRIISTARSSTPQYGLCNADILAILQCSYPSPQKKSNERQILINYQSILFDKIAAESADNARPLYKYRCDDRVACFPKDFQNRKRASPDPCVRTFRIKCSSYSHSSDKEAMWSCFLAVGIFQIILTAQYKAQDGRDVCITIWHRADSHMHGHCTAQWHWMRYSWKLTSLKCLCESRFLHPQLCIWIHICSAMLVPA